MCSPLHGCEGFAGHSPFVLWRVETAALPFQCPTAKISPQAKQQDPSDLPLRRGDSGSAGRCAPHGIGWGGACRSGVPERRSAAARRDVGRTQRAASSRSTVRCRTKERSPSLLMLVVPHAPASSDPSPNKPPPTRPSPSPHPGTRHLPCKITMDFGP